MLVDRARVRRYARGGVRWARLLVHRRPGAGVRVFYGRDDPPRPGAAASGGTAKIQRLAERFPSSPYDFSVLYLASNWLPRDLEPLVRLSRRRGIPLVVNQDGVGYPGWAGNESEAVNRPLRRALLAADHVLYQSAFCKRAADEFLGEPPAGWEILPNAVDTGRFTPPTAPPADGPTILLGGDQTQTYRLELALRTFALVRAAHPEARLLVSGSLASDPRPIVAELGLGESVELVGRYAQRDAPSIFRRAHLLLHTKVNDPCPSTVLEAMATGLPVVYPRSGGVPELVGDEAGIGVSHPDTWARDEPPTAEELAIAVEHVLEGLAARGAAARERAVELFDLRPWLDRHAALFDELVGRTGATTP